MSMVREQDAFLIHVRQLIQQAHETGFLVTGGELFRTSEQQALHVKNGRSKTMNSQHLKRLAIDLNFFQEQADGNLKLVYDVDILQDLGDFWESLHPANRWGGNWRNFKDTPHFERREDVGGRTPGASGGAAATGGSSSRRLAGKKIVGASVGASSANQRDDVETIQRLLNLNHKAGVVELEAPLKPDGIYGQKTLDAIELFQRSALGLAEPDGVISPGGPTLATLLNVLPATIDASLVSLIYLRAAEKDVDAIAPMIQRTLTKRAIDTPLRQALFVAQIGHESGELRFKEEIASGQAYEGRRDLGNTEPGDGRRFKGRGLIQLTGRANYAAYGKSIGREAELLENPRIVAEDPELCVDVAGWYWEKRKLNQLADRDDLEAVTRRINGGLNGLADRRRLLGRSRGFLGV